MPKTAKPKVTLEEPLQEHTVGPIPIDASIDISQISSQNHNWVQRGAVVSCEGANHPSHRHFLVRR